MSTDNQQAEGRIKTFRNLLKNINMDYSNLDLSETNSTDKCVYTVLTNNYDTLTDVSNIKGADFICFTDDANMEPKGWKLVKIPSEVIMFSLEKADRFIKHLPHIFLPEQYRISLYVDANLKFLTNSIDEDFFSKFIFDDDNYIYLVPYTYEERRDIYHEAAVAVAYKRADKKDVDVQIKNYFQQQFPSNTQGYIGVYRNNFMLRSHNNKDCILLDDAVVDEIIKFTKRDQISLPFCKWKLNTKISLIDENLRDTICRRFRHQKQTA